MTTFLLATVIIAAVMGLIALGGAVSGRRLRGSCGGPDSVSPDDEEQTCCTCGRKKKFDPPIQ